MHVFLFKSVLAGFLVVFFAFSMPLFGEEKEESSQLVDGEYIVENDMVKVSVMIQDNKINTIQILRHKGSSYYEEKHIPLIENIIETQSPEVDAISGATVTSNAIKDAVKEALFQAQVKEQND